MILGGCSLGQTTLGGVIQRRAFSTLSQGVPQTKDSPVITLPVRFAGSVELVGQEFLLVHGQLTPSAGCSVQLSGLVFEMEQGRVWPRGVRNPTVEQLVAIVASL